MGFLWKSAEVFMQASITDAVAYAELCAKLDQESSATVCIPVLTDNIVTCRSAIKTCGSCPGTFSRPGCLAGISVMSECAAEPQPTR